MRRVSRARSKLERLERITTPEPIGDIVLELIDVDNIPLGDDGRPVDVFQVLTEHAEAEP